MPLLEDIHKVSIELTDGRVLEFFASLNEVTAQRVKTIIPAEGIIPAKPIQYIMVQCKEAVDDGI